MSNLNYLHEYSTFNNTQELNEAINDHIQRNQYQLNETAREVFLLISRYSVKYDGVSHLKIDTIANIIGKSSRTVQRAIRKLEKLNMIERIDFIRGKSGGNGANIYVIMSVNIEDVGAEMSERADADKSHDNDIMDEETTNETINLLSYSSNTDDAQPTAEEIIHESIANNTPKPIIELLSPFFYGSELYKYVGILFKAKYRPHVRIEIENHIEDFKACIYDVMRRFKAGYIRNLESYLFTSIKTLARRLFVEGIVCPR